MFARSALLEVVQLVPPAQTHDVTNRHPTRNKDPFSDPTRVLGEL